MMDVRLRELTWVLLLILLVWTVLTMIKRGVTQIIEVIEGQIFETSVPTLRESIRSRELRGTLLSALEDEIVMRQIWPVLHKRVNVSLLWRLRRVNRAWRNQVGNTIEWAALEVVRLDSLGYLRFLAESGERRPSMQERVERELSALRFLLSESLGSAIWSKERQAEPSIRGLSERESRPHWTTMKDVQSKEETWSNCMCRIKCPLNERMGTDIREAEASRSEEEDDEDEGYTSSTDSSLAVYYPRHALRV